MQVTGLKAVYFGKPLPNGVNAEGVADLLKKYTKFTQPYQGGISLNFTLPSSKKWYREGEKLPTQTLRDATSGEQKVTWNTMDYGDDEKKFYYGENEDERADVFEREVGAAFVAESGAMLVFARLKIVSTPGGGMNATGDPVLIQSEADVLAPSSGKGYGWDVIAVTDGIGSTPESLFKPEE